MVNTCKNDHTDWSHIEVVTQDYVLLAAWSVCLSCEISLTLIRNGHLLVIFKQMHISAWEDAESLPT